VLTALALPDFLAPLVLGVLGTPARIACSHRQYGRPSTVNPCRFGLLSAPPGHRNSASTWAEHAGAFPAPMIYRACWRVRGASVQYEVVSDRVVAAELDGEAVLLDVSSGLYYGLDEVGSRIWMLLNEAPGLEAIVSRLRDEYEAAPDDLQRDVAAFIDALVARGLVRVAQAG